jgi:hypothetical protein
LAHSRNVSLLTNQIAKFGVSIELSFEGLGRTRPPFVYFHAQRLQDAYLIQMACVLANISGMGWSLKAFFAPMNGISLSTPYRAPGQLRFMVSLTNSKPTLIQRAIDGIRPFNYDRDIDCLIDCLTKVSKTDWLPCESLIERGFVM